MKALKIILGVVFALVLVIIVLGMTGPKHVHIERSVDIDAPADFVFSHANTFEAMQTWSPWAELDPEQVTTITGEDGVVGTIYEWEGNDQVGKGEQIIKEVTANKIVTDLHFIEPFEGMSEATFTVESAENGSKATWAYDEETNFMSRVMYTFINMDEMLGSDFQKGMDKLKSIVESAKADKKVFNGMEIMTEELSPKTYLGLREVVSWADMSEWFAQKFGIIYPAAAKAGIEPTGAPSAIYYVWDEANQQADVMACMPAAEGSSLDNMSAETVAGKALVIEYFGSYEGSAAAHEAMEAYMQWHGVDYGGLAIEEYITDPMNEPDTAKWHTRIMYTVK